MIEWEVFLDDGTTMNSGTSFWEDVPENILVLKVWYDDKKMILWGLSHYGHPSTLKAGTDVSDEIFNNALLKAQQQSDRPSKR